MMNQSDSGDSSMLAATLPHAQSRRELHTKFKKSASEPVVQYDSWHSDLFHDSRKGHPTPPWHNHEPLCSHQAGVPLRHTPHPYDGVYNRWPKPGWQYGLVDDVKDHRRHTYAFGARQLRFKPLSKEAKEVPEMTLDELRNYLTQRYGSLRRAFDAMDFFRDGQLSAIEWQEGMYNVLHDSFGTENHNFRMAICPRKQFNVRMQHLFSIMDENKDGLINFEQLSRPYLEPGESGFDHSRRRNVETKAHFEEKNVHLQASMLTGKLRQKGPPEHHKEKAAPDSLPNPLRGFAVYVMKTFKDVDMAFAAFDIAGNGQLNLAEFTEGARRIRYRGNAEEIFKLLDSQDEGTICRDDLSKLRQLPSPLQATRKSIGNALASSFTLTDATLGMSRKEETMARKLRANIKDPLPHDPGLTLVRSDVRRPLQLTGSAAGFSCFPRTATGRLDTELHPNQLPGEDPEQFSSAHGPGFVEKGPEHFPFIGMKDHPRRGDGWKFGATWNCEKRFGLMVPSRQGQEDRGLAGYSYLSHEGRNPSDYPKISNTGGLSWSRAPVRPGITNPSLLHKTR